MNSAFSEWQEQLSHSICCWKKRPELHNSEGVRADECSGMETGGILQVTLTIPCAGHLLCVARGFSAFFLKVIV